jgi:glutathione S-transferase
MITLFGNLLSGNVHKVQMILRRKGIPFRWLRRVEAQPGFIPMLADGAKETLSFADYFRANV